MPLTLSVRSNIPDCTAKRSFLILLRALKRNNVPNFKTALPSWAWALFPDIIKSATYLILKLRCLVGLGRFFLILLRALKRNYVPNLSDDNKIALLIKGDLGIFEE
ncbi:MAG: hypothetical protein EAZ10_22450 [Oscillatoriales cyanobacterium]|nr:MAG: hypothetical protein EAZ10_22450 [Oscillatoriales cyanobacterium]